MVLENFYYLTQDLLDPPDLAEYKGDGLRQPSSRCKTNKYDIAILYVGCSMLFVVITLFVKECKATS